MADAIAKEKKKQKTLNLYLITFEKELKRKRAAKQAERRHCDNPG